MRVEGCLLSIVLVLALAVECSGQKPNQVENTDTPSGSSAEEWKRPAEIAKEISVRRCFGGGNAKQQYFLMRQREPAEAAEKCGLLVILPGGPGSADFLPFCANVLTRFAVPDDFLVAQLVAPQWREGDNRIVWPSQVFPDKKAEFTTEAFIAAVIDELTKKEPIDERFVFTLGWSSSGHVLYSASTRVPQVRGSVIAMSRFLPGRYVQTDKLQGKCYYLYHSPDDRICRFAEAELAVETLTEHGARAKLVPYEGGHGWRPFTFYADRIREGILWLKEFNAADGCD
jgi:predicted esterase